MLSVLYFRLGLGPGLDLVTAGLEAKIMALASLMWPWPRPYATSL